MTANTLETDCRFCSQVAKANGQDPIGSAGTYDHWIIAEIPQPWPTTIWKEHPIVAPVMATVQSLREQGISVRPLMIAPERDASHPDKTRLFYYRRPTHHFATFAKQEFILPTAEVVPLVTALLQQPDHLPQFEAYRQPTDHIRELFVCVHGNVDVACSRFGYPIYQHLKKTYAVEWKPDSPYPHLPHSPSPPLKTQNPKLKTSPTPLRVWRCSHFGGHNFAPTLIDLPEGRYWGHLDPDILEALIHRNVPVAQLRPFYRGWAGLGQYEQILERELWMQFGWEWLSYLKAGQTLAIDPDNEDWEADWAEVRIDYASPDGTVQGAYTARVEVSSTVLTQWSSKTPELEAVKQYRVCDLIRV